ncbi:MAG TPA: maleylpyruvate isomerase family mycothiol-dependent enzyme [Micromonosporaceae bacterium]|jgi:uncharacterized protein (TIGR03083 family)|nr:maleylpyruvate isomerase family mycothiol-dependent enzyme [Micromonosporaceae bacterium]
MDSSDVRAAAGESITVLGAATDRDWDLPVPDLEWDVARVVRHMSEVCLWYAADLTAGPRELSTMQISVTPTTPPGDLVDTLKTFAEVLARVIDGSAPDVRGWHPFGMADPSGYAAMACDEILVHSYDAALGLGAAYQPDPGLCERTLRRIFPWAPTGTDPWQALLWANGRIPLPDRPRLTKWRWHCAPLDEWSGEAPIEPA